MDMNINTNNNEDVSISGFVRFLKNQAKTISLNEFSLMNNKVEVIYTKDLDKYFEIYLKRFQ